MPPHRPRRPQDLIPGDVIDGRYQLKRMIGHGGQAILHLAEDLTNPKKVFALKFPLEQSEENIKLVRHEVGVGHFLRHTNVCRTVDAGETADGLAFGVMEYVEGENLRSILDRCGLLPRKIAERLASELWAGVRALHAVKLVHRDLKPDNIMVYDDAHVKITDLGIAVEQGLGGDEIAGSYEYMAPEQTFPGPAMPSADIYTVGLVLYEVFTGVQCLKRDPSADGDASLTDNERILRHLRAIRASHAALTQPPSTYNPDLDVAIDDLIMKCLQRDPRERRDANYHGKQWAELVKM